MRPLSATTPRDLISTSPVFKLAPAMLILRSTDFRHERMQWGAIAARRPPTTRANYGAPPPPFQAAMHPGQNATCPAQYPRFCPQMPETVQTVEINRCRTFSTNLAWENRFRRLRTHAPC